MWKQYYKNYYISDKGEVKNINTGRILKQYITHQGYYRTNIRKENKTIAVFIHQAVASLFIPNPLNLPMVNHKDGNKLNNEVNNLEWCTTQENITHSIETGLKPDDKGCNNIHSKFNPEDIIWIRMNYIKKDPIYGCRALAKKFNVGKATISDIINYKTYKNIGE